MTRPTGYAPSEPGSGHPTLHPVEVEPLPAPFTALRPAREDDGTLWTVWGFDSYFRAADPGFLRLLGWTEAELSSASYWDFVHPEDRDPLVEGLDETMTASGRLAGREVRVLGRDGGWHRLMWDVVADHDAELMCGIGTRIEVGECADGRPRRLVGTWVRQGGAGTATWSEEMYTLFGIPLGTALTDALVMSRVAPGDRPLVEQVRQARLADGDAHGIRFRTLAPDGTTRRLESAGRVVPGGHPLTTRGITIDVTDVLGADR